MFGDGVYDAFCQIKHAFDPHGLFNPGKIVDAPPMTDNLRYAPGYRPAEPATVFDYSQAGGLRALGRDVQRHRRLPQDCRAGRCARRSGPRCDEKDSTRGRANALRLALAEPSEPRAASLRERWVHEVLDLCLMCKACKIGVPQQRRRGQAQGGVPARSTTQDRPRPLGHLLLAGRAPAQPARRRVGAAGQLAAGAGRLALAAGEGGRHRPPPQPAGLHSDHFRRWFARAPRRARTRGPSGTRAAARRLLHDLQRAGRSAGRRCACWSAAGYAVELAGADLLRPDADQQGLPATARKLVAGAGAAAGRAAWPTALPILGLEPSCLLTLADEWPELVPGADDAARSRRPPTWPTAGSPSRSPAGAVRPAAAAADRAVRAPRPLPSEGAASASADDGGAAAGPRPGRDSRSTPAAAAWPARSASRRSITT